MRCRNSKNQLHDVPSFAAEGEHALPINESQPLTLIQHAALYTAPEGHWSKQPKPDKAISLLVEAGATAGHDTPTLQAQAESLEKIFRQAHQRLPGDQDFLFMVPNFLELLKTGLVRRQLYEANVNKQLATLSEELNRSILPVLIPIINAYVGMRHTLAQPTTLTHMGGPLTRNEVLDQDKQSETTATRTSNK
jgi:hypothetical protein